METTIIFIIFLIITFIIMVQTQKNKGNYDERQEAIRNRGYKYGFFTMAFVSILILYLRTINIKVSGYLATIIPLYSAFLITSIYDVINHAYFKIKVKNVTSNGILLIAVGILESYFGITNFNQHDLSTAANFGMLGLYFFAIGSTILFVNYRNKRDDA